MSEKEENNYYFCYICFNINSSYNISYNINKKEKGNI